MTEPWRTSDGAVENLNLGRADTGKFAFVLLNFWSGFRCCSKADLPDRSVDLSIRTTKISEHSSRVQRTSYETAGWTSGQTNVLCWNQKRVVLSTPGLTGLTFDGHLLSPVVTSLQMWLARRQVRSCAPNGLNSAHRPHPHLDYVLGA